MTLFGRSDKSAQGGRSRAVGRAVGVLVAAFFACVLTFSLLAVGAASIPRSAVDAGVRSSLAELSSEGQYYRLLPEDESWQLDNYTTAIMLNQASHSAANPVLTAAYNFQWHGTGDGDDQISALSGGLSRPEGSMSAKGWIAYGRYWHGYLVFLKPLLVCFDLYRIRMILLVAFAALLGWSTVLLARSEGVAVGVLYLCAFAMANVVVGMFSLPFSPSFFVGLGATVFVQRHRSGRWDLCGDGSVVSWLAFYLVVGAITVFLDFLDTPIITLGLPLCMQLYLCRGSITRKSVPRVLALVLGASVCWAVGYVGLMLAKWVLSTLATGFDFVHDGLASAVYRSGSSAGAQHVGRLAAVRRNVGLLAHRWVAKALALPVAATLVWAVASHRLARLRGANWWFLVPLLVVAIYPYAWYVVAANHSYVHAFITYRDQVVALVAVALAVGAALGRMAGEKPISSGREPTS